MRMRILIAGLVAAGLLATAPATEALTPTCKTAAAAEAGPSNIYNGHGVYTGTVTPGDLDPAVTEEAVTTDTDTSSGRVDLDLFLGSLSDPARPCTNLTYTFVALDHESVVKTQNAELGTTNVVPPVEIARTTAWQKASGGVSFSLDIPEHPGKCVSMYATVSVGDVVVDRSPKEGYAVTCLDTSGSGGGTQYWN